MVGDLTSATDAVGWPGEASGSDIVVGWTERRVGSPVWENVAEDYDGDWSAIAESVVGSWGDGATSREKPVVGIGTNDLMEQGFGKTDNLLQHQLGHIFGASHVTARSGNMCRYSCFFGAGRFTEQEFDDYSLLLSQDPAFAQPLTEFPREQAARFFHRTPEPENLWTTHSFHPSALHAMIDAERHWTAGVSYEQSVQGISTRSVAPIKGGDILYIPVKFEDGPEPDIGLLREKAEKVKQYYADQSNGEMVLFPRVLDPQSGDYVELDGSAEDHFEPSSAGPGQVMQDDTYCEAVKEIERPISESFRSIAIVYQGPEKEGVFTDPPIPHADRPEDGDDDILPDGVSCEQVPSTQTSVAFMSIDRDGYGTHAHEFGHTLESLEWSDYRAFSGGSKGDIGPWGLMGSGGSLQTPAPIMGFHLIKEDWRGFKQVSPNEFPKTKDMYYMRRQDKAKPIKISVGNEGGLFDYYLIEARNHPGNDPDIQPQRLFNRKIVSEGTRGIEIFGVIEGPQDKIFSILNPDSIGQGGIFYGPTLRSSDPEDDDKDNILDDPSGNVRMEVTEYDKENKPPKDERVKLTESSGDEINGIEVLELLRCDGKTSISCPSVSKQSRLNSSLGLEVRAVTPRGIVGEKDGRLVNEVEGASMVAAGRAQKIYIPRNISSTFVLDTSTIHPNISMNVSIRSVNTVKDGANLSSKNATITALSYETLPENQPYIYINNTGKAEKQLRISPNYVLNKTLFERNIEK